MFELSNSSKANLSGLKTNIKLLIQRSINKSEFYFEIKMKEKVESRHNASRSFDIISIDSREKAIAEIFKQEFRRMQIEGHFCTCESLLWEGDLEGGLQTHFTIY